MWVPPQEARRLELNEPSGRGLGCEDVTGQLVCFDASFSALDFLLRMLTFFLCWQFLVSRSDSVVVMKVQEFCLTSPEGCAVGHFHNG